MYRWTAWASWWSLLETCSAGRLLAMTHFAAFCSFIHFFGFFWQNDVFLLRAEASSVLCQHKGERKKNKSLILFWLWPLWVSPSNRSRIAVWGSRRDVRGGPQMLKVESSVCCEEAAASQSPIPKTTQEHARDAAMVRSSTCIRWWHWRLAEGNFGCPQLYARVCVIWQAYCASVKMQAATWSPVNSMYPSCACPSLTTTAGSSNIIAHFPLSVLFYWGMSSDGWLRFWIATDVQRQWPLSEHLKTEELLNSGQWWNFCICAFGSSSSHLHTVNGPWCSYSERCFSCVVITDYISSHNPSRLFLWYRQKT